MGVDHDLARMFTDWLDEYYSNVTVQNHQRGFTIRAGKCAISWHEIRPGQVRLYVAYSTQDWGDDEIIVELADPQALEKILSHINNY